MFLHLLNKSQQAIFFSLSKEMIAVDGKLDQNEIAKINSFSAEIYGGNDFDLKDLNHIKYEEVFDTEQSKMVCLIELIGLCYVDGKFCDKERDYLLALEKKMQIKETKLEILDRWVKKLVSVTAEGVELLLN